MTDPNRLGQDALDANWEMDTPPPDPVKSLPPAAELEQIDAAWDHENSSPAPVPRPATISGVPASGSLPKALETIDRGWDVAQDSRVRVTSEPGVPNVVLGKKDRRALEKQARAHQFERSLENREQRKARRRAESKQRALIPEPVPANPKPSKKKREQRKAAHDRKARRDASAKASTAPRLGESLANPGEPVKPLSTGTAAPNRAERRSKAKRATFVQSTPQSRATEAVAKKPFIGPFALFIGVVLVASLLSYAFIR